MHLIALQPGCGMRKFEANQKEITYLQQNLTKVLRSVPFTFIETFNQQFQKYKQYKHINY